MVLSYSLTRYAYLVLSTSLTRPARMVLTIIMTRSDTMVLSTSEARPDILVLSMSHGSRNDSGTFSTPWLAHPDVGTHIRFDSPITYGTPHPNGSSCRRPLRMHGTPLMFGSADAPSVWYTLIF